MLEAKAVFFDRDGVLNKLVNNRPPWKITEISIFNEIFQIIKLSKDYNYIPVVITNQPDAGRGKLDYAMLHHINNMICKELNIDHYYVCDHPYDGMCECRKPKPGMILKASLDLNINIENSFLVGDREKDIMAGKTAGCKTIFLSNKKINIANYHVSNHIQLLNLFKKIFNEIDLNNEI